jgi:hypothetical protein
MAVVATLLAERVNMLPFSLSLLLTSEGTEISSTCPVINHLISGLCIFLRGHHQRNGGGGSGGGSSTAATTQASSQAA